MLRYILIISFLIALFSETVIAESKNIYVEFICETQEDAKLIAKELALNRKKELVGCEWFSGGIVEKRAIIKEIKERFLYEGVFIEIGKVVKINGQKGYSAGIKDLEMLIF